MQQSGGVDRIIKYRFEPEVIEALLNIKWWNWSDEKIKENIEIMYDAEKFFRNLKKEGTK